MRRAWERWRAVGSAGLGAGVVGEHWHDVGVPSRLDPNPVSPQRSPSRVLDRRALLRSAGGGAAAVVAVSALAACADKTPAAPDVLVTQEVSARTDAAWAKAAIAAAPEHTVALNLVAAQRLQHADALRAEIDRAVGVYGDGTKPKSATPPVAEPTAPTPPPTVAAVRARLADAQRAAAQLATAQTGYRAGLLASISACCATHAAVVLA